MSARDECRRLDLEIMNLKITASEDRNHIRRMEAERDAAYAVIAATVRHVDGMRESFGGEKYMLTANLNQIAATLNLPPDTLAAAHTTDLREQSKHYAGSPRPDSEGE